MKLNFPWQKIQLINAAKEFATLRLWDRYDNLDFFVVETPLEGPVVACIMGAGMQEFGLCIFRGPDAFQQPFLLNQGKDALAKKGDTLGFSMEYYQDMHHEEKKWYKTCNYRTQKNDWLPAFIILHPGKFVEMPEKDHDIKLLLHVIKGVTIADTRGKFHPITTSKTGSKMLTIQTSGNAENPTVQVTEKSFSGSKELLVFCNKEEMFEELEPSDKHPVEFLEEPDIDLSVVPDADDLKGWKAVSAAQTNRFIDFWNTSDYLRKDRPSTQFFGDPDWDYYLDEYRDMLVLPSYVTWSALCYRTRKEDATYAEQLLEGELPQALRIVVEALNSAHPSLYQIAETDAKAGTLILKDLLLGGSVTVHDRGLSESSNPGWIVPLRVFPAGAFHFIDIAGPIFGVMEAMAVLEQLRALKLPAKPTASWLRENAHIFGRLWSYYDETQEVRQKGPELRNTDGDPLEFITAQFGYSDAQTTRKALKKRKDIDYDEEEDTFVWLKESGNKGPTKGPTLLGRIFFEDGFVKAEVNSKKRFKQLKKRLEDIGLTYHSQESKNVQQLREKANSSKGGRAKEKTDPDDLSEEVKTALREQMTTYYMDWLDTPIPILGNKTPRQAAKTFKGAQEVRIMIETIPAAVGNAGAIEVLKTQMLRELGLEDKR